MTGRGGEGVRVVRCGIMMDVAATAPRRRPSVWSVMIVGRER